MLNKRGRRLRGLPVNSLIPNILTVLALCAGMSAIRFALQEKWELAVAAILVAGVLDGLDGRMARLLKGATKFGAELDSLSDFIAFGVAPSLVVYLWSTNELGGVGWICGLAFSTCCALRLARFNTALEDPDKPAWAGGFFTGVAAPAGGACVLLPMAIDFQLENSLTRTPALMAVWVLLIGFLMISRVPTYSFKRLRVKREHVLPVLLVVALCAAVLAVYPWFVLSVVAVFYLGSIPFSYRKHRSLARDTGLSAASPAVEEPGEELLADDAVDEEAQKP